MDPKTLTTKKAKVTKKVTKKVVKKVSRLTRDEGKLLHEMYAILAEARNVIVLAEQEKKRPNVWVSRYALHVGSLIGKLRLARKAAGQEFKAIAPATKTTVVAK